MMKKLKIISFFIAIIFSSSLSFAATGDVLSSFTAPSAGTSGVTFDGTYLWLIDTLNRDFVKVTKTGSVVSSAAIPASIGTPVDLEFDGTNLWVTDITSDKIFKVSTAGAILSSFDCPCTQPMGITFDGTDLWIGSEKDKIVQVSTSGTLIKTISSPVVTPQGLAYANNLLWISGLTEDKINATPIYSGLSVFSFTEPDANTRGLAFDGTNLWAAGSLTDKIYELELNPVIVIPAISFFKLVLLSGLLSLIICVQTKKLFL
jgi:hypothetical protein